MKCVICGGKWDNAGLITGRVDLTTADTPRGFGLENQPICAGCISKASAAMAANAKEAVDAIEKVKGKRLMEVKA